MYKAINRERGNSCLPKVRKAIFYYFLFLLLYIFLFLFYILFLFLCQSPVPFASATRRSPTFKLRSRVGFYLLVAGLINPTALLMMAQFFNLPVPIGQDFLLPYMTDRSIITDYQHGLNSWAPAIATGVLTTAPAGYFMKCKLGN